MLKIDGFGPAIIGQCCCWDGNERVDRIVYDGHTILGMLIGDGMEPRR